MGYKCYSPSLQRHFVCANVTFNERSLLSFSIFPPDPSHYFSTRVPSMSGSPKVPGPSENPLQVYVRQKKSPVAQLLVPPFSIKPGDSSIPLVASTPVDPNSLSIALLKGKWTWFSHPFVLSLFPVIMSPSLRVFTISVTVPLFLNQCQKYCLFLTGGHLWLMR